MPALRIDHLVWGAPDLDAGIAILESRLGARALLGGRHPDFGTRNAILSLGPATYLEILAPDPTAGTPPRLFGLDGVATPRLITWMVRVTDVDARLAAARERGLDLGPARKGRRETADGRVLAWRTSDVSRVRGDGLVPVLIDWGTTPHPATAAPGAGTLLDLRGEHPDPESVGVLLRALGVDLAVAAGPRPALFARIETPRGVVELT